MPPKNPQRMNAIQTTLSVLIPENFAARMLEPVRRSCWP